MSDSQRDEYSGSSVPAVELTNDAAVRPHHSAGDGTLGEVSGTGAGVISGGVVGAGLGGPVGAVVGAVLGGVLGAAAGDAAHHIGNEDEATGHVAGASGGYSASTDLEARESALGGNASDEFRSETVGTPAYMGLPPIATDADNNFGTGVLGETDTAVPQVGTGADVLGRE